MLHVFFTSSFCLSSLSSSLGGSNLEVLYGRVFSFQDANCTCVFPPPGAPSFVCCDLQIVIKFKFLRSGYEICSVQLSEVTRTEGVLAALLYKILILNQMLTVA